MSGINSVTGRADISQVLAEMRNLRAQIQPAEQLQPEISHTKIAPSSATKNVESFGSLLTSAID